MLMYHAALVCMYMYHAVLVCILMYHAVLVCMLMYHAVPDDEKVVSCPNCPICHNPVALLPARYERGRRAVGFALWDASWGTQGILSYILVEMLGTLT